MAVEQGQWTNPTIRIQLQQQDMLRCKFNGDIAASDIYITLKSLWKLCYNNRVQTPFAFP